MSWRANLLPASFRGAKFFVNSSDYQVGRRTQLHQYANRDKPYLQDLGSEADSFSIEAFIIQNIGNGYDYFAERDALITALKQRGPGTLIHPFFGIKKVGLEGQASISESFDEGGIAKITMTFREAGVRALPLLVEDFLSKIDNAVNQAFDTVGDYFFMAYNTAGAFMSSMVNAQNRVIELVQIGLNSTRNIATRVVNEASRNAGVIKGQINDIIGFPTDMYNSIVDSAAGFAIICGLGQKITEEKTSTLGFAKSGQLNTRAREIDNFISSLQISDDVVGGETGSYSGITRGDVIELNGETIPEKLGKNVLRNIVNTIDSIDYSEFRSTPSEQQSNICLLMDVTRFSLLLYACRIGIRITFFSKQDLLDYLELITNAIDETLLLYGEEAADGPAAVGIGAAAGDPVENRDVYNALDEVRQIFIATMLAKAEGVSKSIEYQVKNTILPSLVLAYNKYEDITRADEIFQKNRVQIRHPGFLPAGQSIRILSE